MACVEHDRAVFQIQEIVKSGRGCDESGIRELHRLVMTNLDDDYAGLYRNQNVIVAGAPKQPLRAEKIHDAMQELFAWITTSDLHPVVLAGEAHYRFVKIHSFFDGNGRTGPTCGQQGMKSTCVRRASKNYLRRSGESMGTPRHLLLKNKLGF